MKARRPTLDKCIMQLSTSKRFSLREAGLAEVPRKKAYSHPIVIWFRRLAWKVEDHTQVFLRSAGAFMSKTKMALTLQVRRLAAKSPTQ